MWRQSFPPICDQTICLIFVKSSVTFVSKNWQADTSLMKTGSMTAILYLKVSLNFHPFVPYFLANFGAIW